MIAALCANPCVDRTVAIDKFVYGGMNRIRDVREEGSGKGVNVALACAQLGLEAACTGFLAGERGPLVLERLRAQGCRAEFVPTPGAVRVNTKVLDRSTGTVTELNEAGAAVLPEAVERLTDAAAALGRGAEFLVMTGSLPPGCPQDFYRALTERLRAEAPGCRVVLDAEGPRLAEGLKAAPFLVKPNRYELELLCGRELPTLVDIHGEALALVARGVAVVAVSLGGEGAYCTDGREAWFAPALDVPVKSTVGAGDSMIAGMLLGFCQRQPLAEVFRCGVAAATSSVTTEGTQLVDVERYRDYLEKIELRQVL